MNDTFTLYDLKVEVVATDRPMVCSHTVGDYFLVQGENLIFPDGCQSFSMYALSALLPLLPAKQRELHPNDWMLSDCDIASKYNVSIANVATQYILKQKSVGAVMIGTRNSRHVASNLKTLQFELSEKDMSEIKDFIDSYPKLEGDCYTLERTSPKYQGIILTDLNKE